MSDRKPFGRLHPSPTYCAAGLKLRSQATWRESDTGRVARQLARRPESVRLQNQLADSKAKRDVQRAELAEHLADCQTCSDAAAATP